MIYFCSDLDNTLIYSYRREIGNEKILVEVKDGKELSYMTKVSHELLKQVSEKVMLVPLTTRSLEQFSRIDFGSQVKVKYAMAANGGILLEDGKINEEWYQETKKIVEYADEELEKGIELLKKDENVCLEIKKVDGLFVYTKSHEPEETMRRLKEVLDTDMVYIDNNGEKVYIFPKKLDKGSSLERLRNYVGQEHSFFAAGDSYFDIPMLISSDKGFCPESLNISEQEHVEKLGQKVFSDVMLQRVLELA